jgi:methionine-rich copper-binding protein CopC
MRGESFRGWIGLTVLALTAGCAGNGDGLDQNGQPITPGSMTGGPVTADFQSIQDNVFTPICSKCHIGAGAPEGLQLDAAHSYAMLVGVPSAEVPSLLRVNPGNPDTSYMVLKIEGAPGIVGVQMPEGETPLPQTTIDAIRQWITNGAPNASTAAAAATAQGFAVQATAPLDQAVMKVAPRQILVAFSHELDASLLNETTITLERIPDMAVATESAASAPPERVAVTTALAKHNPKVLLITPRGPLDAGVYRITLRGTGGGALADLNATTLGADVSFRFSVETAP